MIVDAVEHNPEHQQSTRYDSHCACGHTVSKVRMKINPPIDPNILKVHSEHCSLRLLHMWLVDLDCRVETCFGCKRCVNLPKPLHSSSISPLYKLHHVKTLCIEFVYYCTTKVILICQVNKMGIVTGCYKICGTSAVSNGNFTITVQQ